MPISRTSSSKIPRIARVGGMARAGGIALAVGLALAAPQAFAGNTPAGGTPAGGIPTGVTGQAVPDSGASFQNWAGSIPYIGNPPYSRYIPSTSGFSGMVQCYPVGEGGGCTNIFSGGGGFASQQNIQALGHQMRADISWLGYTLSRSIRNRTVAQAMAKAQANGAMPASAPCAGHGPQSFASSVAGNVGAFGVNNPIAGALHVKAQAVSGLTVLHAGAGPVKSWNVHDLLFCSALEVQEGLCSKVAANPTVADDDIAGSTLLGISGLQAPQHPQTDVTARAALIHNLTDTLPVRVTDKNAYQTAAGKTAIGMKLSYSARMSLAQEALDQIAALHTPVHGLGKAMDHSLRHLGGATLPNDASIDQVIALEYRGEVGNPSWYGDLANLSGAALQREVVLLQAQNLQYQYIAFQERTAIESLLATLLAQQTETQYRPLVARLNAENAENASGGGPAPAKP